MYVILITMVEPVRQIYDCNKTNIPLPEIGSGLGDLVPRGL